MRSMATLKARKIMKSTLGTISADSIGPQTS